MSAAVNPPPGPTAVPDYIAQIAAPLLIGTLINFMLYGVLGIQVYIYHITFRKDPLLIKCLVYGVFLIETLQVCLSAADAYYWFCSGFGNMAHIVNPNLSAFDVPLFCVVISFAVHCFFSYRIWVLRKNYLWVCILIISVSVVHVYGGISGSIRGYIGGKLSVKLTHAEDTYLWLICSTVVDVLIASILCMVLLRSRQKEYQFSNELIMRLVRLVVETNSLTAGITALAMILLVALPNKNYFIAPTLIMGKLYSNTLLITLNNRSYASRTEAPTAGASGRSSDRTLALNSSQSDSELCKPNALDGVTENDNIILVDRYRVESRKSNFRPTAV